MVCMRVCVLPLIHSLSVSPSLCLSLCDCLLFFFSHDFVLKKAVRKKEMSKKQADKKWGKNWHERVSGGVGSMKDGVESAIVCGNALAPPEAVAWHATPWQRLCGAKLEKSCSKPIASSPDLLSFLPSLRVFLFTPSHSFSFSYLISFSLSLFLFLPYFQRHFQCQRLHNDPSAMGRDAPVMTGPQRPPLPVPPHPSPYQP